MESIVQAMKSNLAWTPFIFSAHKLLCRVTVLQHFVSHVHRRPSLQLLICLFFLDQAHYCLTKRWVYCNWLCPFSTDRFVEEGVVQGPSRNACLISSCSNYFKPYQCPNSIYSTLKLQTYSIDIAVAPLNSTHPLYTQWHIFKLQNLIAPVIMCLYTCAVYIAHLRKAHNPLHAHAHIIKHQTTIRMHTSCQCQHA